MKSLLDEIVEFKKEEIQSIKVNHTSRKRRIHGLKDYIKNEMINIIAEIKSSSPSAGFITDIDLEDILPVYEKYASAISVLCDNKFFNGSFDRLGEVADMVNLPVLCKDFIIDKVQIDKAYESGADMVLLIVRILDFEKLKELYDFANQLGLDVLVEVHSVEELNRIKPLKPEIIGVNSRDLDTLDISLNRAKNILEAVDFDCIKIAESGIRTKKDIEFLHDVCDGFLIGESLLKSKNIEEKFKELL